LRYKLVLKAREASLLDLKEESYSLGRMEMDTLNRKGRILLMKERIRKSIKSQRTFSGFQRVSIPHQRISLERPLTAASGIGF
jgi:hypothetical protein